MSLTVAGFGVLNVTGWDADSARIVTGVFPVTENRGSTTMRTFPMSAPGVKKTLSAQ